MEEWRPISEAPRDCETIIDVVVLHVESGRMHRRPNVRRVYGQQSTVPDTWAEVSFGGQVVHGRRFYDEDGDECFEWGNVPGAQIVVTHFMLPPPLPMKE